MTNGIIFIVKNLSRISFQKPEYNRKKFEFFRYSVIEEEKYFVFEKSEYDKDFGRKCLMPLTNYRLFSFSFLSIIWI